MLYLTIEQEAILQNNIASTKLILLNSIIYYKQLNNKQPIKKLLELNFLPYFKEDKMNKLLSIEEVSELLGVKVSTLYSWVHMRKFTFVKVGRLLRFEKHTVDEWIRKNRIEARNNH